MTSDLDLRERHELCDLFLELGPDAPTLSGEWRTADLAAHLVVRERDLIGAPGIVFSPMAGLTQKRMASELERHGYEGTVARVRSGPPFGPMKIAAVRYATNLLEYYVHHEDVRRANGRTRRTNRPDLDDALWDALGRFAPLMYRKARVGDVRLRLVRPDGQERSVGKGSAEVVLSGEPSEVALELYGRRGVTEVTYEGPDAAVAAVRAASFGV